MNASGGQMQSPNDEGSLHAWLARFWSDDGGASEEMLIEAERRLGCEIPQALRLTYAATPLRDSAMLHLRPLSNLAVVDNALVFLDEQQGCWSWAVALDGSNKLRIVSGEATEAENATLVQLLAFWALSNRPYEVPCTLEAVDVDLDDWEPVDFASSSITHRMWVKGSVVAENIGGCKLGARSLAALNAAIIEADEDPDDVDIEA